MAEIVATADEKARSQASASAMRALPAPDLLVPRSSLRAPLPGVRQSIATSLDQRRLFVLSPFAVIAGLIASLIGAVEPASSLLALIGLALLIAFLLAWRTGRYARVIFMLAAFHAGFSLLALHGALFGTEMLARPVFGTYQAVVDEVLDGGSGGLRVIVSGLAPVGQARPLSVRRARLTLGTGEVVAPGEVLRAPMRLAPVPGPVLPGAFDARFHSYFDGIGAYGTTTDRIERLPGEPGRELARLTTQLRQAIAARIDAHLSQPAAGIARSIINGDQSAVTDDARDTMARAGLAHVLSISGLHLTIVAGGVYAALRMLLSIIGPLAARVAVKRLAAAGGILAALGYFAISGGNVAALRSTLMIILIFGAVIVGRRALTMRNVAFAALFILFLDPASVFRPSFQLSFAAVVGLIGVYESLPARRPGARGPMGHALAYLLGIASTSLIAGIATLLFSAYHFQQTSPLGVLGNVLSLPLVGFVMMPAAFLAVALIPFGWEEPFVRTVGWSADRMLDLAGAVVSIGNGLDSSPLLTPAALLVGLVALAWFAFFSNWWRLLGPGLAVPAVLLFALDQPPDVLIADTTQAVALLHDEGLSLVTGKADSFAVAVWMETFALPIKTDAPPSCDAAACLVTSKAGFTMAVIDDQSAFDEECTQVDLVVTRLRAPASCRRTATVVDAGDLRAGGVHWVKWNAAADQFEIRSAITQINRPWQVGQP